MTRLIDADELIKDIHEFWDWDTVNGITATTVLKQTITDIQNAPTVDAVPVKHGKWMLEQERFVYGLGNCWWNRWSCSCCGYVRTKGWAVTVEGHKPKAMLCENCGARMDEE